ncbi:MAG TPA: YbbR-like domain-containing protein, partial [Salinimicrobium sp.]|nr:YbbR-like domain-containing protein [Salinimicrobium sp.]
MHNTGFKIAYFSLFPPTLMVDIAQTEQVEENLIYSINQNLQDIENQLDIDYGKSEFLIENLVIHFQQRKEKVIPVFPRIEVEFAVGYAAVEKVLLKPDSITVSGPDNILDTLNQLVTVPLTLKDVKDDLLGEIAVDTSNLKEITVYKNQLQYSLDVEKFTEGRVEIPVDLINVPPGLNVVVFPKEVILFYQVNLKDFNKVNAADFRVVCDFGEMGDTQNFLIPKIVKQPPMVTNLRLNENKIQFIIKK